MMRVSNNRRQAWATLILAVVLLLNSLPLFGQTIIPVSDIAGGSTAFVFKSKQNAATARFVVQAKSKRTKDSQIAGAKKINRQYVDLAKVAPRRTRTTAVDPNSLPPQERLNHMPKEQASKLFAGVGEWYIDREDNNHAEDFFRTAYTLDPSNNVARNGLSEALSLQGNDLLARDQGDAAKRKYDESVKLNPNNAVAYYGLGQVAANRDDNANAAANFEKALGIDPALTDIYVPLGVIYYQNGETEKADRLLTKALAQAADDAEVQYFYGLVRYSQNKNPEALAAFRKAKEIKPDYAEAWYYTGMTLLRQEKPGDAAVEFNKATELKPDYFEAWFSLGTAYLATENYPKAVEAFGKAVRLKNSSPEAQANLGDAYRLAGDFQHAEGSYNLAAALATNSQNFSKDEQADVYNKTGFVIAKQCDAYSVTNTICGWGRAVTALEKAVAISKSPVDYANLGWAYYNAAFNDKVANMPDQAHAKLLKAKENLEKAVATSPSYVDGPLLNLAMTNKALGDTQGAVSALKKVVDNQPKWAFARTELGNAYLDNKDPKAAAEQFQAAIRQDDKFAPAYLGLGKAQHQNGNHGDARKAYLKLKSLGAQRMADELAHATNGAVLN